AARPTATFTPSAAPLVFDGVLKDETTANQAFAIIEDTSNAKVTVLKVGDAVPGGGGGGGKITKITLEKLEMTQADGKVVSISIGQNLQGAAGASALNRATPLTNGAAASGGETSATTGPASSAPAGSPRQPG